MKQDRLSQLLQFLERAPKDAFTLYSIAYEFLNRNEHEKALKYFRDLKNIDPNYTGTYYHLGKTLEKLDRKKEAIGIYKEGIQITQKLRDFHALSELRTALNSALGLDYEDEV